MPEVVNLSIESEYDIIRARQAVKNMASHLKFSLVDQVRVATTISELALNVVLYARKGNIVLRVVEEGPKLGLEAVVSDDGPGIPDIELAMTDGFTTSGGLGAGLPGAKRLMDEFDLLSKVGKGTVIKVKKWKT